MSLFDTAGDARDGTGGSEKGGSCAGGGSFSSGDGSQERREFFHHHCQLCTSMCVYLPANNEIKKKLFFMLNLWTLNF